MTKSYETERLSIKTLSKDAAPMVLSFFEDSRDLFEPWEPARGHNFYTLPYQRAFLTAERNLIGDGKLIRYWVFLKDHPSEIIGTVCFQNILKEPYYSCCLGYKLSNRYLHQGYATESIGKCIDIVFHEYQMHRIDAYIMPNNTASLGVVERLAFHKEGLSESYARINGVWTDHVHYALINPADLSDPPKLKPAD